MRKKEYVATVGPEGKLTFADRTALPRYIAQAFKEGEHVLFTVQDFEDSISRQQLRYYHGPLMDGVYQALKDAGYDLTKKQARAYFESQILSLNKDMIKVGFEIRVLQMGLSDMTKDQMTEIIDWTIRWCAEQGIEVMTPEEYYQSIGYDSKGQG